MSRDLLLSIVFVLGLSVTLTHGRARADQPADTAAANDRSVDGKASESQVLAQRLPWTQSRLQGSPDPPLPFQTQRVFPKLTFQSPMKIIDLPGRNRRLVLERAGRMVTFDSVDDPDTFDVALDLQAHLDVNGDERIASIRDMTLDPNFPDNGYLYCVWAIQPHEVDGGTRVSRYQLDDQQVPSIDPETRLDIISYPSGDHIGASLCFADDGLLWITTGDGSLPFPPDIHKTAQNLGDLRGKVLRIDVRDATVDQPYQVPAENPFVDLAGARPEVYAFGIRNGFRSAIDPSTQDLWVADVGWERCELIHRIQKGGNHGWSLVEGPFPVDPDQPAGPGEIIEPAIVMQRNEAQSVTGGVFVPASSNLNPAGFADEPDAGHRGHYVFGCFMNGGIWTADVSSDGNVEVTKACESGLRIIGFANTTLNASTSGRSDVLVVDYGGGGIYRMIPSDESATQFDVDQFPRRLSETGLFSDLTTLSPNPGVAAYHPRATMNRDGASAQRVFGIPGDGKIAARQRFGQYVYPEGTVFANTISRDVITDGGVTKRVRVETQILAFDGLNWDPYSYRWDDEQQDATLVDATGDRRQLTVPDVRLGKRAYTHQFGSRSQCLVCHHVYNLGALSFRPDNLTGTPTSAVGDSDGFDHWSQLVDAGYVEPFKAKIDLAMVNPHDPSADLELRARSYLEMNCAACHRPAGGSTAAIRVQWGNPMDQTEMLNATPLQGGFGLDDPKVVVPGHPQRSVLMYRTATLGPGRMPKLVAHEPDFAGAKLLWDWIESMEPAEVPEPKFVDDDLANSSLTNAMLKWNRLIRTDASQSAPQAKAWYAASRDPAVRGLFESWIPVEQRHSRVGDAPDAEALLAIQGDADRGKLWFTQSSTAQCRGCHRITGNDPLIGPSLEKVGTKFPPRDLLDQLLNPSRVIDPKWQTHLILTVDGTVITGLRIQEDAKQWTIRSADGRDHVILIDDIDSHQIQTQSLMPAGLCASMTPNELADLVAFLSSLR
ncbi:Soluble aldose sugar dehydrogenase YliI precursor [Rubripirellula lacrimiformis]|uniref:Soluble aldose sugar dehydrogenase YliI n=1 Tax=Rubripirellula lacrimiformis TaxID=1930273 RepID=A0A517NC13_9BACT|nr:PQQ-dependent sugar dehydrogenase [Rubripirellula lacrimiformis]QDT04679.1 Soluble aldose sugar dehydrogenase YliI precursor [Rubripirellula lacrimiformis]